MPKYIKFIFYFMYIIFIYGLAKAYDIETKEIMPFVSSKTDCLECHETEEMKSKLQHLTKPCDILCLRCHRDIDRHHKVGYKIIEELPKAFDLAEGNRIACFTCHDLSNKRYDNSSWKAESLFEKFFGRKSKYKTYYLVIKNNKGQLCKKCH